MLTPVGDENCIRYTEGMEEALLTSVCMWRERERDRETERQRDRETERERIHLVNIFLFYSPRLS